MFKLMGKKIITKFMLKKIPYLNQSTVPQLETIDCDKTI